MVGRFRRGDARTQGGLPALLLETTGARSGETRHAILGYLEDGPDAWLVIAALAGAARHPAWLYNLARRPGAVIEFKGGRRVDVVAETLEDEQLEAAWARIGVDAPEFVGYRSKTDRELPVVRLRQRASGLDTTGVRSDPSRSTDSTTSSPGSR
jgi:deazaflavin-dependent oxidoreductase (nitroreductase family)